MLAANVVEDNGRRALPDHLDERCGDSGHGRHSVHHGVAAVPVDDDEV